MTTAVESYLCDETEARELTDAIKATALKGNQQIKQAMVQQAWAALGYPDWDSYCLAEFGTLVRLSRDERQIVAAAFRDDGMSLRAIASATGNSVNTVRKDIEQVYQVDTPVTDETPDTDHTPTADRAAQDVANDLAAADQGYADRAAELSTDAGVADDVVDAEVVDIDLESEPAPEPPRVKGRDGRSYPATGRKNRKAITETAKTRGFKLRKSMDSLMAVFGDDRYAANEKQVADLLRGHLLYVAETVAAVLDQLPTN